MSGPALAVVVLTAALVQSTAGPDLAVAGAQPNLVLAMVTAMAWSRGRAGALVAALGGGLLLDLCAQGPLGVHAVAVLVAVFLAGALALRSSESNLVLASLAGALAGVAYSCVVLALGYLLEQPLPAPAVAVQLTLATAGYQAVLTLAARLPAHRLRSAVPA